MLRALSEYEIEELKTLLPFHSAILATPQWDNAETCRDLVEDRKWLRTLAFPPPVPSDDEDEPKLEQTYTVEVSGRRFDVRVIGAAFAGGGAVAGPAFGVGGGVNGAGPGKRPRRERKSGGAAGGADTLPSPMQGNMWRVKVKQGDTVEEGQLLCIIEAMKMENEITAHKAGVIAEIPITEGAAISAGDTIAVIRSPAAAE
jgi:acetyl-CoA/propionyl-CoA carboxylase biotin carboxyl carrier protein